MTQDVPVRYKIIFTAMAAASLLTACADKQTAAEPTATATATAPVAAAAPAVGTSSPTVEPSAIESSTKSSAAESSAAKLKIAVQAYSDAFLSGDAKKAYGLLSERCRKRTSLSEFTGIVTAAKGLYGNPLPFKTYSAKVSGGLARVTYTYAVKAINQDSEPWSRESGTWHQDDC
jgi:hypothetical protein